MQVRVTGGIWHGRGAQRRGTGLGHPDQRRWWPLRARRGLAAILATGCAVAVLSSVAEPVAAASPTAPAFPPPTRAISWLAAGDSYSSRQGLVYEVGSCARARSTSIHSSDFERLSIPEHGHTITEAYLPRESDASCNLAEGSHAEGRRRARGFTVLIPILVSDRSHRARDQSTRSSASLLLRSRKTAGVR